MICLKCKSTKEPQLWTSTADGILMKIDEEDHDYEVNANGRDVDQFEIWAHICRDCGSVVDKGFCA